MAFSSSSVAATTAMPLPLLIVFFIIGSSSAQLSPDFYAKSCPNVFTAIKTQVDIAINKEARMGASLLRLFFHDCFVNGCDGSVLLDDTANFTGEKKAAPNYQSARGFEVVDNIKSAVEEKCPGIVSCADVLAITARDSVVALGGPSWAVKLGRRDSVTASQAAANSSIPPPTSNLNQLITFFNRVGLSTADLVALAGGHTIGEARCTNFRTRVYNETNIEPRFAQTRQSECPRQTGSGDNNLAPLDAKTQTRFDNNYFSNLVNRKGLLHSDQQLYNGGSTDSTVLRYTTHPSSFLSDFTKSMIRMGDIKPLTGSSGQIRTNCRNVN